MAVIVTVSNHFKYQLGSHNANILSDTLKAILMNTTFTFDKDAHATLADVTANQIATADGYTQDNKTLTGVAITENDTTDKAVITFDNVTWTSTGSIGPTGAAILYDDTTSDNTVICCIDFGTDYTISSGNSIQLQNLIINIA